MGGSANYFPTGYDRVIRHQMRNSVESLEISGKDDLINVTMDEHNHVTLEAVSDKRKENVIDTSVTGQNTTLLQLTISHGTNNTEQHSTLTLNASGLQSMLSNISGQIVSLDDRVTQLEIAGGS